MKLNTTHAVGLAISCALVICAAACVQAGTTGIISGVVTNAEDSSVLSGANVIVVGTKLTTVTDANGYFVITNVPPREYEVASEMVGFAVGIVGGVQVTMDATATVDFQMNRQAITEETVIVRRPRPMIDANMVNTLNLLTNSQEQLIHSDPVSTRAVPGVLATLPGVVVAPNGLGEVHMRGGRADQIGYYIEGIPVTDPNTGFFSTNLFTTGVHKFQTYPGGFGAQYGNAISGVMNEVKMTGGRISGFNVDSQAGNRTFRSALAQMGGESPDGFSYYVGSAAQRSELDGGPLLKEQEYSDSVAKLVWPSENDTLTVMALQGSLAGYLDSYHDVGNLNAPTPHEKDFLRQRYAIGAATWSHNFSPGSFMTVRPYYIYSGTVQNMMGGFGVFLNGWSAQKGLQLRYTSQLSERHLLNVGGSVNRSTNSYYVFYGFPFYRADVDTSQTALFVQDEIKIGDQWNAELGARFESIKYDRTGNTWVPGSGYSGAAISDVTQSVVTPRVGLSYAQNDRTVWKTSWGKYTKFTPSSLVQWVYFDPDTPLWPGGPPAEAYQSGIGAAAPQKSTAWDISYEKQLSDSVAYRVTPFYASYQNLGEYVRVGGVSTYTTLGSGRSAGVELMARKKMSNGLQGWVSYTYSRTRANRADAGFPSTMFYTSWDQRHVLSLVADHRAGRWSHNLRADFGSGLADIATSDPTVQSRAEPYLIMTYTVSADLPEGSSLGDSIYVSIYNLLGSGQALQHTWEGPNRVVDSHVPSRFISMGFTRSL